MQDKPNWSKKVGTGAGGWIYASPVIDYNGTIYVVGSGLHKLKNAVDPASCGIAWKRVVSTLLPVCCVLFYSKP
jgi:hypothetical protein